MPLVGEENGKPFLPVQVEDEAEACVIDPAVDKLNSTALRLTDDVLLPLLDTEEENVERNIIDVLNVDRV